MKLGLVAGEASGDILGAGLLEQLQQAHRLTRISGMGGPKMIAAGCQSLFDMERLSVMGLIEPLSRLPELFRIRSQLHKHFLQTKPDVFIGIDSPDFNLGLELKLKRAGIPVIHYVSPSVWAWRQKRIFKIAKATDRVLTLFPFEAKFYEKHQVPATFVGHPLADAIPLAPDKQQARSQLGLEPETKYIALLPGSRRNELRYLGEVFLQSAVECLRENSQIKFITSAANAQRNLEFQELCRRVAPHLPITFFEGQSHAVMAAADVVLVTSGTATLETMLLKRPMVVAYRMANLTYQIARHIVKLPYVSLPNLLAEEKIVPEFIQDQVQAKALAKTLLMYLHDELETFKLQKRFTQIHEGLQQNANYQAANAVLELLAKA